jgi:hypothetical protein
MHRLTSVGLSKEVETILRVAFGPVSATVLMSLHEVGLPAMREELDDLQRAADDQPPQDARRTAVAKAVLAWRLSGLVGRVAEQLSALAEAVDSWQAQGEPVFADGRLGEVFLRARPRNPRDTFQRFSDRRSVRTLLGYPAPSSLLRMLPNGAIRDLDRRLNRSADKTAQIFRDAATAFSDESYRTFIRWKHAVSITSPLVVPVWIAETDDATKRQALEALVTGFGIIDLESSLSDTPHLIIWPDSDARIAAGLALAVDLVDVSVLVLESVLCWAHPDVAAIPVHASVASAAHERVCDKLARLQYRRRLATKAFDLSAFPNEYG